MCVEYQTTPDEEVMEETSTLLPNKFEESSSLSRFGSFSTNLRTKVFIVNLGLLMLFLVSNHSRMSNHLASILFPSASSGANTIKMCVQEMIKTTPRPSRQATIQCWDKDTNSDDKMTSGETNEDGCATLKYKKTGWDQNLGVGKYSPDIFCTVTKASFVESTPTRRDNWDQSKLLDFGTVTLYRDRRGDSGRDNGCGAESTEWTGGNDLAAWVSGFGDQCAMHDHCYYDCQIFNALGKNRDAGQKFCDDEMRAGMYSFCNAERGDFFTDIGSSGCKARADAIYSILRSVGKDAYGPNPTQCKTDDSLKNDYSHPNCWYSGKHCGFDGTFSDDTSVCNNCCKAHIRSPDEGYSYDDFYCGCLPRGVQCGSNYITNNYNGCSKCCGKTYKDSGGGWSWDDYYCEGMP